jgi:outer membrane lipoprotein LolB
MSAGFSLDGDARQGELNLFSPLGTTLATLQWNPATTQWLQGGQHRRYDSMAHLTEETTGAALPMDAMFDWLQGKTCVTRMASGSIGTQSRHFDRQALISRTIGGATYQTRHAIAPCCNRSTTS